MYTIYIYIITSTTSVCLTCDMWLFHYDVYYYYIYCDDVAVAVGK